MICAATIDQNNRQPSRLKWFAFCAIVVLCAVPVSVWVCGRNAKERSSVYCTKSTRRRRHRNVHYKKNIYICEHMQSRIMIKKRPTVHTQNNEKWIRKMGGHQMQIIIIITSRITRIITTQRIKFSFRIAKKKTGDADTIVCLLSEFGTNKTYIHSRTHSICSSLCSLLTTPLDSDDSGQ